MSVDDIFEAIYKEFEALGELDNTYLCIHLTMVII